MFIISDFENQILVVMYVMDNRKTYSCYKYI